MNYPQAVNNYLFQHVALMVNSYSTLLNKPFIESKSSLEDLAKEIFHAPFVLVSHGNEADPVFNYANLKGLELFEFSWEEFTRLPSRLSAEAVHQAERIRLLDEVNCKGYIDDYQGVRIAKSGRRFIIKQATVWNLIDQNDQFSGQAACFNDWQFI